MTRAYVLSISPETTPAPYTLAADTGAYALSSPNNAVSIDRNMAAVTGAYTYTGTTSFKLEPLKLAANSGSYDYTGSSAVLSGSSVYLYNNDIVGETEAGVNLTNYNDSKSTTTVVTDWWNGYPALQNLLLNNGTEDNTGSQITSAHWSGTSNPTLNFRCLVEFGSTFFSSWGAHPNGPKFIWNGNAGDGGNPCVFLKGVIDSRNELGNGIDHVYYVCYASGANGDWPRAGEFGETSPQDWYNSNVSPFVHQLRIDEYAGQQICFEWETTLGGDCNLYVSTQDGTFTDASPYASTTAASGIGNLPWTEVLINAYTESISGADSNTWVRYGQLVISEGKIGPPSGFYL